MKHILYGILGETKFANDLTVTEQLRGTLIDNTSSEGCSTNSFFAELEKEINANQRAKVEHEVELEKRQFELKVNSFMQQLLFKTSSIIETNASMKYKAELLQTLNQDYQFVLRSMTERNPNSNPTVVKIYRI